MSFINELIESNLEQVERINPAENIKNQTLYENGEYSTYIGKLREQIKDKKYLDIYTFFLAINSEIILNINSSEGFAEVLFDIPLICNLMNKLSPSNEKQRILLIQQGLNSFLNLLKSNLEEVYKNGKNIININEETIINIRSMFDVFEKAGKFKCDKRDKTNLFELLKKINSRDTGKTVEQDENRQKVKNKETIYNEKDTIQGSYKWNTLLSKINVLKKLVENNRVFETAIVYEDVINLISNFDPQEYFPEVFFPFYKQIAPESRRIHKSIDKFSTTVQWKVAKHLYNIDHERFLNDLENMEESNLIDQKATEKYFYESKFLSGLNLMKRKNIKEKNEDFNDEDFNDEDFNDEDFNDEDFNDEDFNDEDFNDEDFNDEDFNDET